MKSLVPRRVLLREGAPEGGRIAQFPGRLILLDQTPPCEFVWNRHSMSSTLRSVASGMAEAHISRNPRRGPPRGDQAEGYPHARPSCNPRRVYPLNLAYYKQHGFGCLRAFPGA